MLPCMHSPHPPCIHLGQYYCLLYKCPACLFLNKPTTDCLRSPSSSLHHFQPLSLAMPQCNPNGCTFFAKVAFNLSKHESQCQFRHAATRAAPRQHCQQYNGGHARPLPHPCENDGFSVEENREINPQPLSSTPSAHPGFIEDSYIAEVSQRPSSELLVHTIILSLHSISSRAGESLTNDLIAVLRDNEFPMDLFRERVKDVSQVKRVSRAILQKQMAQCGFLKIELMDNTRKCSGILHYTEPIDVLRKRLSLSDHLNSI